MTGSSTNNRMARNGIDWGSVAIFFSLMLLGWLNIYAACSTMQPGQDFPWTRVTVPS